MAVNGFFLSFARLTDNLYPGVEGLLCSEEEVFLTQGPLQKWAE